MIKSIFFVFISTISFSISAQPESWFIEKIAAQMNGQTEVSVENGRIDIVTDTYAIEVEKAATWKHAIGQSMWYALQKNLTPGIVLLVLDTADWNMGMRLNSTLQYAGLDDKIKVWYYPQDFDCNPEQIKSQFEEQKSADPAATGYWLSTNSGVRHNTRCQWYTKSKGKYCTFTEGRPCGSCGG